MNYQHFTLVEVKKGMVESLIQKTKSVEDVREEWRCHVRDSMIQKEELGSTPGRCLWLHFGTSATDFKNKFCGEGLPIDLFDCAAMQNEETKKKFFKEGDPKTPIWGPEFKIVLTSEFSAEDVQEFLGDSIPLDKLKVINVTN